MLPALYTFYGEPDSLNDYINAERTNRHIAAKMKKKETNTIAFVLHQQNAQPWTGKIDLELQAYAKDKRKDPDNIYVFFLKCFLDAMQLNTADGVEVPQLLPNDSQRHIGKITFLPVAIDKQEPRIEVTITKSCQV